MDEVIWATSLYAFLRHCNYSSLSRVVLDCGAGGSQPPLSLFYQVGYTTYGIEIAAEPLEQAQRFGAQNDMALNIVGVGLLLLLMAMLLETLTILVRRWVSLPIPLSVNLRILLSVPCILVSVLGLIWFNRTLNLVRIHFLDGEKKLATHGPFHYVRHPLYTALLIGVPPLFVIWYADIIFLIPWLLTFILAHFIVRLEERGLIAVFGDEYRAYMLHVPALIPYKGAGGRRFRKQYDERFSGEG